MHLSLLIRHGNASVCRSSLTLIHVQKPEDDSQRASDYGKQLLSKISLRPRCLPETVTEFVLEVVKLYLELT